jgi:hypothetical protein
VVSGDRVNRVRVPLRLLTDVELHKGEPEGRDLEHEVQQAPVGDGLVTGLDQGFVAHLKGLQELFFSRRVTNHS